MIQYILTQCAFIQTEISKWFTIMVNTYSKTIRNSNNNNTNIYN